MTTNLSFDLLNIHISKYIYFSCLVPTLSNRRKEPNVNVFYAYRAFEIYFPMFYVHLFSFLESLYFVSDLNILAKKYFWIRNKNKSTFQVQ